MTINLTIVTIEAFLVQVIIIVDVIITANFIAWYTLPIDALFPKYQGHTQV